jgi:membrane protein YqaA with SNARE-associated domain
MGVMIASLLWGFSEATLFFIIPDVLLSAVALRSGKKAVNACFCALIGALIGGSILYVWGAGQPSESAQIIERVPAIDQTMIREVKVSLASDGLIAMVLGPTKGIPYKIYAITANSVGISYLTFLIASIPARFLRFFLVSILTWSISTYVLKKQSMKIKYTIWAAVWIIIYIFYFLNNPS